MTAHASAEWRQFEQLVARLETALHPYGATVKSPDRIRDTVTGRLREVDASIRFNDGENPTLITVECRRRRYRQDDPWIEQLASKRLKIGAAKTIAVSSRGFTESARTSARHFGIELRTFEELNSVVDQPSRQPGMRIKSIVTDYGVTNVRLFDKTGALLAVADVSPESIEDFKRSPLDAVLIRDKDSGVEITARAVAWKTSDADVPIDGVAHQKTTTLTFLSDSFVAPSSVGEVILSRAEFDLFYTKSEHEMPVSKITDYTDLENPLLRIIRGTAELPSGEQLHVDVTTRPDARFNIHSIAVSAPRDSAKEKGVGHEQEEC